MKSSEEQLQDHKRKSRHRLIGACIVVLAAVIVVPWLTSTPPEEAEPVRPFIVPPAAPEIVAPADSPSDLFAATDGTAQSPEMLNPSDELAQANGSASVVEDDTPTELMLDPIPQPEPEPTKPADKPTPPQAKADTEKPKPKPAEKPVQKTIKERTDDGSVALALLEGRTPPTQKAPAADSGIRFIVQIASLASESEAQSRRQQLVAAGITDAFVAKGNVDGRTTYRVRVGPFSSRESAQAAQTRLRSLGYSDSFIAKQ